MDTYRIFEQLSPSLGKEAAGALASLLGDMFEELRNTVTKSDFAELKAVVTELGNAQKRTEQRVEELAAAQKKTEETMKKGFDDVFRRFDALGSRWGDQAEETFRQGILETVKELGYSVEYYLGQDPEGFINHHPRSYDLDILVHNGTTVVAEIKSNASGADVFEFYRSKLLFEKQTGRKVDKAILIAVTIHRQARQRAAELGIIVSTDTSALN